MKTRVAIVGGGPGGAASAMFLKKYGIDSVIVEKEQFPRYHIGESMTGECGAIVRDLGLEPLMEATRFPVKRGLTVYGKDGKNGWFVPTMGRDEEWKLFRQPTWQVRRDEFDKLLLDTAVERGTTLIRGQANAVIQDDTGAVRGLKVALEDGGEIEIESEVVVDASGMATFLANQGIAGPKFRGNYDRQIAVYSQVESTIRDPGEKKDDTLIFYKNKYHWAWFIPLTEDRVSVGIGIPSAYFQEKNESKEAFLIRELLELNPELAKRVPDLRLVEDARSAVNYSYQVRNFTGPGYICIGDAHRFIDPIFSFGLFVTMKEAQLSATAIKNFFDGVDADLPNPFIKHEIKCEQGIDIVEDVVDTFWEHPLAFATFTHHRFFDQMVDILSGRIYDRQPSEAVRSMRKLIKRDRHDQAFQSVPAGSRYHPERADIGLEEYE